MTYIIAISNAPIQQVASSEEGDPTAGSADAVPEAGQADLPCCAHASPWAEMSAQSWAQGRALPGMGTEVTRPGHAFSGRARVGPSGLARLENYTHACDFSKSYLTFLILFLLLTCFFKINSSGHI